MRATLIAHGDGAVFGGLTAAGLDGMTGYVSPAMHVLIPAQRKRVSTAGAVVHRSNQLSDLDVHPVRAPRRARLPRSLIDAAG